MCLQTGLQVGKGWWPRQHSTQMTGIGCCGFSEVSNRFLRFQLHVFYGGTVFLHWDQPQIWLKKWRHSWCAVLRRHTRHRPSHQAWRTASSLQDFFAAANVPVDCPPSPNFSGASSSFLGLFWHSFSHFSKSICIACGLLVTPLTHISLMLHWAPSVTQTGPQRR